MALPYARRRLHELRAKPSDEDEPLGPPGIAPGRKVYEERDDWVTKAVKFVFGSKALQDPEPLGFKRSGKEAFPEYYGVNLAEWADLLPEDQGNKDLTLIRPLLKQTRLEQRPMQLIYDASRHGWSCRSFHQRVDRKGPCVVLARTRGGSICGGYNAAGWVGVGELRGAASAFLFTWPDGDTSKRPLKLPKVGGAGVAICDFPDKGVSFGMDGFVVPLSSREPNGPQISYSKLGPYYSRRKDGFPSLFSGVEKRQAELVELKVYAGIYKPGEAIPDSKVKLLQLN
ncbi:unnamed protein product [Vitrella brassicaformis CCMP3155]|uniref:TLDc domain-containing protein n=1 Tax=Vitrella brassicaformis (strain CCMP3155) TaxID=1169540 RepID=A0A0G4GXS3_VITBC|nr:unnamed protein product [Vitrella brassicaformis CCMP3155]|eukprot:CEM35929.1 unnamed protein product [Vitrella brassicaformis CCMP3155]